MTPVDAIWLFLVKTWLLPATSWLSRNASGIDYPSKKLSKMAGYSASYSFNSWCIGIVCIGIV